MAVGAGWNVGVHLMAFVANAGSEDANTLITRAGVASAIMNLVSSPETAAMLNPGATAAYIHDTMNLPYGGFAITAKPSANLYVLLQVSPGTTTA